ncbi:response regulator [Acidovorax sp. NCPPB 3576]|uniref:response regulator n=1 Tax=Acidovorax sp. NCPPB 3576 TaxID=2940488 RepID=UPI002349F72A|nr:response regulator [Acidovorax sp. NCPPB 3576]WCM90707.1 response regulator [Acidovorax sp. NCPPB 3576]
MKSKRVLVVDDHRDSADMLCELLMIRDPDLSVQAAYDGLSGLEQALNGHFDVVILDLMLPRMNGAQVAREIRSRLTTEAPILVALSGSVAEVAQHQDGLVFNHALTKPLNVERLMGIFLS